MCDKQAKRIWNSQHKKMYTYNIAFIIIQNAICVFMWINRKSLRNLNKKNALLNEKQRIQSWVRFLLIIQSLTTEIFLLNVSILLIDFFKYT